MSRLHRWAPLSGVLAVILWIAGIFLITQSDPDDHATDDQILAWYKAHTNTVLLGGWAFMLGCLAFIWFAAVLRARLLGAEGGSGTTTTVAFVGAIAAAMFGMLVPAPDIAAAINKNEISAATAGTRGTGPRWRCTRSRSRGSARPEAGARGASRRRRRR